MTFTFTFTFGADSQSCPALRYVRPNVQPQYDQRTGKPLNGCREPNKSGWSHFAYFLGFSGVEYDGVM